MKPEEQKHIAMIVPIDRALATRYLAEFGFNNDVKSDSYMLAINARQMDCPVCGRRCWVTPDIDKLAQRIELVRICIVCVYAHQSPNAASRGPRTQSIQSVFPDIPSDFNKIKSFRLRTKLP